ncbi:MAG TPA: DUF2911 domain-containing protein [Acidobacteriaceae bacterium]|nr:DUF2911 domain-containing protein [Acidobacteriaceae bacterium]
MKLFLTLACAVLGASLAFAQESPSETATATIGAKNITIKYDAPSVRGRKIFGEGGRVMQDPTAPIWRAGANAATSFHTDADLQVGDLAVPKGDYTLFVNVKDPDAWVLILNKQTGQWGLEYHADRDLGRVKMKMSKPSAPIETLKYSIADDGGNKATLQLGWENHIASVPIVVK